MLSDPPLRSRRAQIVGALAACVLRIRHVTWRKDVEEAARIDRLLADGERLLIIFWHGKYIPLYSLLAGRKACVFASLSFRGQVIAEISRRFGYDCVLLPHQGGEESRALMYKALRSHKIAGLAVDGPLGPYHVVKRGAIDIASALGFILTPVSAAGRRCRVLAKRWDNHEIPRLFTRVVLAVGEPLRVPSGLHAKDLLALKERVRESLEALDRRAEERAR